MTDGDDDNDDDDNVSRSSLTFLFLKSEIKYQILLKRIWLRRMVSRYSVTRFVDDVNPVVFVLLTVTILAK